MSSAGFDAGVIGIEWIDEEPFAVSGRDGLVWSAKITRMDTDGRILSRSLVNDALVGLVVVHPDSGLVRIVGVESRCMMSLHVGEPVGLLLVETGPWSEQ